MPVITLIKPQKSLKRFNIYLNGQFSFSIDKESLIKLKLKKDLKVSIVKLKDLRRQAFRAKTIEYLLNLLSYRPRSEKEIQNRLKRFFQKSKTTIADLWPSESDQINLARQILDFFKEKNLIDDKEFAQWWVQQRNQFRPRGQRMLFAELAKKGINKKLIQEIIHSSDQKEEDQTNALLLAQKKLKSLSRKAFPPKLKKQILREKLGRYLASKGFDWPTIKEILKEVLKNE
jgi:regulatory protein